MSPIARYEIDFPLPRSAKAIAAKRRTILVVGAGSSQLPGAAAKNAYPARLQQVLAAKLPGIKFKIEQQILKIAGLAARK